MFPATIIVSSPVERSFIMAGVWIDFAELREKVDFGALLKHFGVELKIRKGDQHQGFCPLPNHHGKRKSPSFSANLHRRIFHCFGCGARGNCIDFVACMQGLNPDQPGDVRKAALYIQEHFLGGLPHANPATSAIPKASATTVAPETIAKSKLELPVVINAPLDFELKGLDLNHPYLQGRGFSPETIVHFGLVLRPR
jgi:CHC2 zinc finger